MKYRFLVTNREGASGSFEWGCLYDSHAREMASRIVDGIPYIQDVTIYRLLSKDSCGPIAYVDTVKRSDL